MESSINPEIFRIASRVRDWAEEIAAQYELPASLCGLCAIAARKLFRELKKSGYSSELMIHHKDSLAHAFVVCQGFIIDVTATQFGKERIFITPAGAKNLAEYWKPTYVCRSEKSFIRKQRGPVFWCEREITLKVVKEELKKKRQLKEVVNC